MSLPEGPHCLRCMHFARCVLAQRDQGTVCGWYNAGVHKLVRRGQVFPARRQRRMDAPPST